MKTRIYLDHAATTLLHPKALEAMRPDLDGEFGNPSGMYALGKEAARAIDKARNSVAQVLGCRPQEIVFTGPGTESINAAIKGVAFAQQLAGLGRSEERRVGKEGWSRSAPEPERQSGR